MRKPTRKLPSLALLLILLVPVLVACGGSPAAAPTAAPTSGSPAPTAASGGNPTAEQPTAAPTAEAAAPTDTPPEPTADISGADKTIIIGMNQFPDTLFAVESQSSATVQVIEAIQPTCVTSLDYDFQAVCFEELPSFENGGAVIQKVTVDSSYQGNIVINNELVTDTSTLTGPIELDQLVVTWKLIDGLAWEDGTPLTAGDFVFAANLYQDPGIQITTRRILDSTEKYEAPDDKTLVWYAAPGYSDATYFTNFFGPEPEHVLGSMAPAEIGKGDYANKPLAYGPYKVVENVPQESTTLVANEHYWRAKEGLPRVKNVVFKYLTSEDQVLQQLESGDIDVVGSIGLNLPHAPKLDELEAAGAIKAFYVPGTRWEHMDFGLMRSDGGQVLFDDVKTRQAVAYAINRKEIVEQVLFGKTAVMNSILPAEHWAYPPNGEGLETYDYDPEKARALLAEAGWTAGADGILEKDGKPFKAQFYTTEGNETRQSVAQIVQENLKAVGIELELNFVPGTAVLFKNGEDGILSDHLFDLAMYGFTSSPDPNMALYLCNQIPTADNNYNGQNNPGWCNEEFDEVALASDSETDRAKRIPLTIKAQQLINQNLPTLPLYQRVTVGAASTRVTGVTLNPTSQQDFYNIAEWDLTE